jgi:hypothetical protein
MTAISATTPKSEVYCSLLPPYVLSIMVENMPGLASHLEVIKMAATRHGYYPDGTLLIEGRNSADRLWHFLINNGLLACGIHQPCGFGGLEEFSNKIYRLYYTTDYDEKVEESGLVIAFPAMWKAQTRDYDVKNLLISVAFKKNPSSDVQNRFAKHLGEWFQSVSKQGVFGEGPVKLNSSAIKFQGRLAQVRIDACQSGQDTLNWLLLTVMNFAYVTIPVTDFIFDRDKQIEATIGAISGKIKEIPIPLLPVTITEDQKRM